MDEFVERLSPFFRKYKLALAVGMLGMIFFVYGLIQIFGSFSKPIPKDEIIFKAGAENQPAVKSAKDIREILVDVEGAVNNPGIYHLVPESRVADALKAAGGISNQADQEVVEKQFNLAAKLIDGSKIYVPRIGEVTTSSNPESATSRTSDQTFMVQSGTTSLETPSNGKININSASESELDTLPGIGPVTAKKIITNRPYNAIEELRDKKAVSSSVFEKIKEKISTY